MVPIKRNRQIKKNIKQNIKFYKEPAKAAGEFAQGLLYRVIMIVTGISVAVCSLFGAVNIIFRIPDFFRYEFDRTEVLTQLDIGVSSNDMGDFFSKFMMHGDQPFSMAAEYEGTKQELFGQIEAELMGDFRTLLNVLLIIAIVAFVAAAFLIAILQYNKMARGMRTALNVGLVIYLAVMVISVVYFNVYTGSAAFRDGMLDGKFGVDAILPQMFDGRFILDSTVLIVAISVIIMMIIRYIVWKMTAQKGIFSEGLKGAAK